MSSDNPNSIAPIKHFCHADGCNEVIHPSLFMCKKHWKMIPLKVRKLIWKHYQLGQEISKTPTQEYLNTAKWAIALVKQKEQQASNGDNPSTTLQQN